MTEPQKIADGNVPDIMLEHRLGASALSAIPDDVAAPEIGDKMKDGTIYAGISPDTGEALYVTSEDAPGTLKWKQAMKYAADLDANGHRDWKLPTKAELDVLFDNRHKGALNGSFNESGSYHAGHYWSSTDRPVFFSAWQKCFRFAHWECFLRHDDVSVRPVRLGRVGSEFRP